MSGIVHTYYAVALAPAIAALVGAGTVDLWRLRERTRFGGLLLAGAVVVSAWWAFELLERTPDFLPGLGIGVLVVGISAAVVLAFPLVSAGHRPSLAAGALAVAVLLTGPLAYSFDTIGVVAERRRSAGRSGGRRASRAGWRRWPDERRAAERWPGHR